MRAATAFVALALMATAAHAGSFYDDVTAYTTDGTLVGMKQYAGNVTVVVNVATYWGETKVNYEMFQALQKQYASKPVRFLLFPCNQFAGQEPKANSVIKTFASTYISLTQGNFALFAKSTVNSPMCTGSDATQCTPSSSLCCPHNNDVYTWLKQTIPASVSWNFVKYVVGHDGAVIPPSLGSPDVADKLVPRIEAALKNLESARAAELRR